MVHPSWRHEDKVNYNGCRALHHVAVEKSGDMLERLSIPEYRGGNNLMGAANQQERPLDPWYLTGFFEGEGCFWVTVHPHPTGKFGWIMDPTVQIYQHEDNRGLLERIQRFFGCGRITPKGPNSKVLTYSVDSRRSIEEKVIPHFDKYPLQSRKWEDYLKFREIVLRMNAKEHWQRDKFIALVRIAFAMNAPGKQRRYTLDEVISGILRDHTPDSAPSGEEMVRSA